MDFLGDASLIQRVIYAVSIPADTFCYWWLDNTNKTESIIFSFKAKGFQYTTVTEINVPVGKLDIVYLKF